MGASISDPSLFECDDASYRELLSDSPQSSIYCNKWWLEAVAPGRYQILTIWKGRHLEAAWPIVFHEQRNERHIVMPRLTQTLGIIARHPKGKYAERLSREHRLIEEMINQLPDFTSFYCKFHPTFTNWLPFRWAAYEQTTLYNYVIPDIGDTAQVWSEMRANARGHIRKAGKLGVRVDMDLSLDQFLVLHDATYARQGLDSPLSPELIRRVDAACRKHAGRAIFAARDTTGAVHAAVYIVWSQDTAYYLLTGSDPIARSSGAIPLALWTAIKELSGTVTRFDFEGSVIQQIEGTCRGFGAQQMPYFAIRNGNQNPWYSWSDLASLAWNKAYRGARRRLNSGFKRGR